MVGSVVSTAARAVLFSGLLSPPAPVALLRLVRELYRGGMNLYTLLAVAAARWPDRTAIIDDDGALSYRELQSMTESIAHELGFRRRGRPGGGRDVPQRPQFRHGGVRREPGGR